MSLQGVLADFGVAEVFQLIGQQRKTGVLEVEHDQQTLEVYFQDGLVLRARSVEETASGPLADFLLRTGCVSESTFADAQRKQKETLEPLPDILVASGAIRAEDLARMARLASGEALFELFLWEEGSFRFRPEEVRAEPGDEAVGAEQVLLDALRMRDEWTAVRQAMPDLSTALIPSVDIEEFRVRREAVAEEAGLPPEDLERLFRLADGRLSAQRVIDLARLGTFAGAKALCAMRRAGMVRADARGRGASTRRDASAAAAAGRSWAGLLFLAIGAALAAFLWMRPGSAPEPWIPADGLSLARDLAEEEQVRFALEAARWAAGGYPRALADAPMSPQLPARYIYERSADGYALSRLVPSAAAPR
jgi:hypothetical protein